MSSEKMQNRQMADARYQVEDDNTELEIDLVEVMYRMLEKAIHNLLKYCELDTYAMVKVWEELVRVVG